MYSLLNLMSARRAPEPHTPGSAAKNGSNDPFGVSSELEVDAVDDQSLVRHRHNQSMGMPPPAASKRFMPAQSKRLLTSLQSQCERFEEEKRGHVAIIEQLQQELAKLAKTHAREVCHMHKLVLCTHARLHTPQRGLAPYLLCGMCDQLGHTVAMQQRDAHISRTLLKRCLPHFQVKTQELIWCKQIHDQQVKVGCGSGQSRMTHHLPRVGAAACLPLPSYLHPYQAPLTGPTTAPTNASAVHARQRLQRSHHTTTSPLTLPHPCTHIPHPHAHPHTSPTYLTHTSPLPHQTHPHIPPSPLSCRRSSCL